MLHARIGREMVTAALELGFAGGNDLVAVVDLQEILVRTTAEDGQTDQEGQSQFLQLVHVPRAVAMSRA